jgi:protein SCO1/2
VKTRIAVWRAAALALLLLVPAACRKAEAPRYTLTGQVLSVQPDRQELTIRHEDIPNFMPAMTMSYRVANPALLTGRAPGELIAATLEVNAGVAQLTSITHTGSAPLAAGSNAGTMAAELLEEGDEVPDAALIDQQDRRRSLSEWRGSLTLVTFIYTRCPLPNFCPLMDQNFATLQRTIAEDPLLSGQVKLISISFDPEHDTPAVLAAHSRKLKADPAVGTFLTGDRVTVDRVAARFGVGVIRSDAAAEVTHNLRTALIDREGRLRKIYSGNDWTPGAVLADLRAAARTP